MAIKFPKPVYILVGLGFPTRIQTVNGALIILDDWQFERDAAHAAATRACRDALLGKASPEDARKAFVAFASAADVLIEATAAVIANKGNRRHGAPA